MNFLRSLALSLLSSLLVLSLSVFGFALTLNYTLLNPNFAVYEADRLDTPSLAEEWLGEQIPPGTPYLAEVLSETIIDLEPWIKDQVHAGIYTSYDYFLGRSQSLNLVISLEPVREKFKQNLRQAILDSLPPELEEASPSQIELYLNQAYREIDEKVPEEFELNESSLTPDVLAKHWLFSAWLQTPDWLHCATNPGHCSPESSGKGCYPWYRHSLPDLWSRWLH